MERLWRTRFAGLLTTAQQVQASQTSLAGKVITALKDQLYQLIALPELSKTCQCSLPAKIAPRDITVLEGLGT